MKFTIISLLGITGALIIISLSRGQEVFIKGLKTSLVSGGKFLPILFIAFLIMGFSEVLMPKDFVEKWLSESSGFKGIGLAWLAGILTPGGSIIAMPLAAGMFKAGASIAIIVTYLTSMAVLSLIRIPLEIGFYGYKLMALRVAGTIFLPPAAGMIALFISKILKALSK